MIHCQICLASRAKGGFFILERKKILVPLKVFVTSRVVLFAFSWLMLSFFPVQRGQHFWRAFPNHPALDGWARFDSGWYVGIAKNGYKNIKTGIGQDTNFFPLFPLSVRLAGNAVGNLFLAGIIVSNAAFLLALFGFYFLVFAKHGPSLAERALYLLAFNPFSFFFSAVYTEALFLFFLVYAFYFCENDRFLLAGASSACAAATRNLGIFTIVGLGLLIIQKKDLKIRNIEAKTLWLLLALTGTLGYMAFLWYRFDDPLLFLHAQKAWGSFSPREILSHIFETFQHNPILAGERLIIFMFHGLVGVAAIVIVLKERKLLRPPYAVFSLLLILPGFLRITSLGRYVMVVFPVFIALAKLAEQKRAYRLILAAESSLLLLLTFMFTHWYWVA